ncbi:MAG: 6,7-dimethyl-8-ribityllumazine synthase [Rhodocyclaceae bacterium]
MALHPNIPKIAPNLDGAGLRIGVVVARFNSNIGDGLLAGCVAELAARGVAAADVRIATVPGALEIPLVLQTMAASGKFDALVALGAVIRGDTYHFEVVSNEMAAGITRVQLDTGIPMANGVLTTENDDQALVRMDIKGRECAACAIEMANLLKVLR